MLSQVKILSGAKTLMAGCALLAFSSAAWADQTHYNYNVAAGAATALNVPAVNTPISFTCANNTSGYRGVGQATILRVAGQFLEWIGSDVATNTLSSNYASAAGTHIVYCSYVDKDVDIQVLSDTQIQIKNSGTVAMTGVINFVW